MSTAKMLKGHELFQSLTGEEVDQISRFSNVRRCQKDDVVFRHGDRGTHLYVVLEGLVHLRLPSSTPDLSIVIAKSQKGDFFGLSPLLGSSTYTLSAQCGRQSELLGIEVKVLREILIGNPVAGINIMGSVAQAYFTRYVELTKRFQAIVDQIPLLHG